LTLLFAHGIFTTVRITFAVVAELADALDSGSSARKGMEVQVLSTAPIRILKPRGSHPRGFVLPFRLFKVIFLSF
jgi:hypothetical protein